MVGRRQTRERRLQAGEALATGGLVVLVVTPIVYRINTASRHTHAVRTKWWPTPWMWLPLACVIIGVIIMLVASNAIAMRKSARSRRPITGAVEQPVVDVAAAEAAEASDAAEGAEQAPDVRTARRSTP